MVDVPKQMTGPTPPRESAPFCESSVENLSGSATPRIFSFARETLGRLRFQLAHLPVVAVSYGDQRFNRMAFFADHGEGISGGSHDLQGSFLAFEDRSKIRVVGNVRYIFAESPVEGPVCWKSKVQLREKTLDRNLARP